MLIFSEVFVAFGSLTKTRL